VLATSFLDVLKVVAFGAAGFLVVVVACVVILAFLQLILPKTDSGAEAAGQGAEPAAEIEDDTPLDTEADA